LTKIVFDISTPKQARFFPPMIRALRARDVSVSVVTRDWEELNLVLSGLSIHAKSFGRHGGASLVGKLVESTERVRQLAEYFERESFDLLVTLSNPESSRAAFGLGIPVFCFKDLPESVFVSKLALPLATRVCIPWVVPKAEITKFGVAAEAVMTYRSHDPMAWLPETPDPADYVRSLGLDPERPIVVSRETEWQSTYARTDIVADIRRELTARHTDWQWIAIPRYEPHPFYDTPRLLAGADLFLGGGGTMCIEAAYAGTPVIATRALDCFYMQWLFERGLAEACTDADQAMSRSEHLVAGRASNAASDRRASAREAFRAIPFPFDEITDAILATVRGSSSSPRPRMRVAEATESGRDS